MVLEYLWMSHSGDGDYSHFGGIAPSRYQASVASDASEFSDDDVASVTSATSTESAVHEMPIVDLTHLHDEVAGYLERIQRGKLHKLLLKIECGITLQVESESHVDGITAVRVQLQLNNMKAHQAVEHDHEVAATALFAHKKHTKHDVSHLSGLTIKEQTRDGKKLVLYESETAESSSDQTGDILDATEKLLKKKGTMLAKQSDVTSLAALKTAVDAAFHMILFHMLACRTSHYELSVDDYHKPAFAVTVSDGDLHVIEQGDVLVPMFGGAEISTFLPYTLHKIDMLMELMKHPHPALYDALKVSSETTFERYSKTTFNEVFPSCASA